MCYIVILCTYKLSFQNLLKIIWYMIGIKWRCYLLIKVGQSWFCMMQNVRTPTKENLSSWQRNVQGSNNFIQDLKSLDSILFCPAKFDKDKNLINLITIRL